MPPQHLRVLLTNDDGPPGHDSPYIFGFAKHLVEDLGWDVKVVIPSSQKSWIGKAFHIKEITRGNYFYPRIPDGVGEVTLTPRPLRMHEGEFAEWILLDGTPATCANIALHNLYKGEIDLVISGPNFGRNSSSAFALSSGTIGAALSSSLSSVRSIALSYGTVKRPTPEEFFHPAHVLASQIIGRIYDDWGNDCTGSHNRAVDLYNVNIPMIEELLSEEGMKVVWTSMWKNAYGRLFKHSEEIGVRNPDVQPGGPDAQAESSSPRDGEARQTTGIPARKLVFKFSPDMQDLINPSLPTLPIGCDAWAIACGFASVTPLRASFAEPVGPDSLGFPEDEHLEGAQGVKLLRLKL